MTEDDQNEWIHEQLKTNMGNVGKRPMSDNILSDVLGKYGRLAILDIKKGHHKILDREEQTSTNVKRSVVHFNEKLRTRRKRLRENINHS